MTRSHSAKATAIGTMRTSPTDDDETAAPTDGAANFLQELATDSPPVKGGEKMYRVGGSTGVFGLSKSRENVRSSVQRKCHSVMPRWYQMMTPWDPLRIVALEDPRHPGIS